jgi:hypothetical protein
MKKLSGMLTAYFVFCAVGTYSQVVTFNSPVPWVTQRNDSITVRAQIDTAQIKKKEFAVSVDLVSEGAKKKTIARKTFKISDYSAEFALGPVSQDLVGGLSYIKIDWSIPGTVNKGSISPVGIVALDKLPKLEAAIVPHAKDGADAAAIAAMVKESDLKAVGTAKCALLWNNDALYIAIAKTQSPGTVRFAIDGKNGKNAFLSFADRVVLYQPDKDSVWGNHFSREMIGDTLKYAEKSWPSEITKTVVGDKIILRVPWYDTGIIPMADRRIGLGIMEFGANGKQTGSVLASANFYLPGTWGDFVLAK